MVVLVMTWAMCCQRHGLSSLSRTLHCILTGLEHPATTTRKRRAGPSAWGLVSRWINLLRWLDWGTSEEMSGSLEPSRTNMTGHAQ